MMPERREITYYEEAGVSNTDETFKLALARAEELRIRTIILPSTRGGTGAKASELFKGYNLVVVTHVCGFRKPDMVELTEEDRDVIVQNGGKILTTTHAFGGLGRAVRRKFNTMQCDEIIANTLRVFGQGMKVACEITLMAADAGLISTQEDAIALGGTGRGVDTAIIVRPVNTTEFFDLRVKEILCKPRL
jgi:hypothetical protein